MVTSLHLSEQAAVCWLCSRPGSHIGLSLTSAERVLDLPNQGAVTTKFQAALGQGQLTKLFRSC